jgi:hypothetical protein
MRVFESLCNWPWVVVASALAIGGCGGGGGGSDDDDEVIASAGGIWQGTITANGAAARTFSGLVTEDGDFGMIVGSGGGFLAIGQGDIQGSDQFRATATAFAPGTTTFPDGSRRATAEFQGTFVTGSRLSGTYSVGGETGNFTLQYQSLYNRVPSLATLGGVWTLQQAPGAAPVTLAINSNGESTLNTSTGCTANGRFSIVDVDQNAYAANSTFGNCGAALDGPWRTIGYLTDAGGVSNNRLQVFSIAANNSVGTIQVWTR